MITINDFKEVLATTPLNALSISYIERNDREKELNDEKISAVIQALGFPMKNIDNKDGNIRRLRSVIKYIINNSDLAEKEKMLAILKEFGYQDKIELLYIMQLLDFGRTGDYDWQSITSNFPSMIIW